MYDDFFFPYEKGKTVDWEYGFVIPFQLFALCITIHDASRAAFMDGAALVLQLCGSRSSHCCFRAGHVPSGNIQQLSYRYVQA